jgi:hypothetical protein
MDLKPLLEHLPFVLATGAGPQLDVKDLVGAILIGAVSAVGSSYITTKELVIEMRVLTKQVETVQRKLEDFGAQHQVFAERLTRVEARGSMNGNSKTERR